MPTSQAVMHPEFRAHGSQQNEELYVQNKALTLSLFILALGMMTAPLSLDYVTLQIL